MIRVKNNVIYVTKGDSASFKINIRDHDGNPYLFAENTVIKFSVKKTTQSENYTLQKTLTNSTELVLSATDTNIEFGKYVYDVQLTCGEKVITIIPPTAIYITEEVTTL